MHPRGFPQSGTSPISPWPGYPNIPIFLDTRNDHPLPDSKRSTTTTLDTSRTSPVPSYEEPGPTPPPKGSESTTLSAKGSMGTTLQIPSTEPQWSEKLSSEQNERSPVRHLSPVEYPTVNKISETRFTKPRTPRVSGHHSLSQLHFGGFSTSEKSGYAPLSGEGGKTSGLGIMNDSCHGSPIPSPPYPVEDGKGSLNITQRIEDRLWQYSIHGNVFKRWLLETISWLISAICMATIVGVLLFLRDRPLDTWPLASSGITLNTFVATLSRIASAALLLPVSEALGQLKWSWFFEGKSKKMWDFEIFDNASRGPWGSFQLLIRTKGRKLAALGAAIVLFALALDPFFQQVLDFPERWTLIKEKCTIPRVSRYESHIADIYSGDMKLATFDTYIANIADKFFFDNGTQPVPSANGTRAEFPFSCPTNNCTWPVYETLGMCSACADVSQLLTFTCLETEVDWISNTTGTGPTGTETLYPTAKVCGYFLNATSETPVLMSGYAVEPDVYFSGEALLMRALPLTTNPLKQPLYGDGSIMFKTWRNTIFDALIVGAVDGAPSVYRNETPHALECVLTWCVKTVKSSYEYSRYNESVTRTFINTTDGPFPWISYPNVVDGFETTYIDYKEEIALDVSEYPLDPGASPRNPSGYRVGLDTAFNVMTIFDTMFPAFGTVKNESDEQKFRYSVMSSGPPIYRPTSKNPWMFPNNVTTHMQRLANALTDAIRADDYNQEIIEGDAFDEETYVSVRWEWLALPLGLLLFTLVFLLLTIYRTSRDRENVGVWKTSAVATLLYGFPDDMQKKITSDASSESTPRTKAKELKVRFVPKTGWRVSGNLFSPRTPKVRHQAPPGWI